MKISPSHEKMFRKILDSHPLRVRKQLSHEITEITRLFEIDYDIEADRRYRAPAEKPPALPSGRAPHAYEWEHSEEGTTYVTLREAAARLRKPVTHLRSQLSHHDGTYIVYDDHRTITIRSVDQQHVPSDVLRAIQAEWIEEREEDERRKADGLPPLRDDVAGYLLKTFGEPTPRIVTLSEAAHAFNVPESTIVRATTCETSGEIDGQYSATNREGIRTTARPVVYGQLTQQERIEMLTRSRQEPHA